ncbi:sensor histidine kinase [Blastopirellula retiformator]|uniref:histidine kinase n=1 Tax=Blastopirellula retiformator TaxID=2527970 RepID=A0A5C5UW77_9BACT|nr:ATP-binding protein [Blastopirellula retiformator]TWT30634.1 putative sensor histidine kinase TcrY [Blastopirellula retiformator]
MSKRPPKPMLGPFRVRSLRGRIQLWYAAVLAAVIIAFGSVLYFVHRSSRFHEIDNELSSAVEVLMGQLRAADRQTRDGLLHGAPTSEANTQRLRDAIAKLNADLRVPSTFAPRKIAHPYEAPYFAIWRFNGSPAALSTTAEIGELAPPTIDAQAIARRITYRNRGLFREAYGQGADDAIVLVGRYIGPDVRDIRNILLLICTTGVVVFAIGLIGGWLVSSHSIRPLLDIRRVAADIGERNLADRIKTERMDLELADLANILNDTFARLEAAFARQRQFTADASHELRTPLAVLQMHQQLALARERSPEEYREALETCQKATRQMRQLVDSMLTLARADDKTSPAGPQKFDLKALVEDCLAQTSLLLTSHEICVAANLGAVPLSGDRDQLGQVITNLLTNLTVHCPPQTMATITITCEEETAVLTIADDGPGIAATDLPQIFDRFYRVDQPRSRQSGSAGLGLSICRTIVEAHGGAITAESHVGAGTTFRVMLPAASDCHHDDATS